MQFQSVWAAAADAQHLSICTFPALFTQPMHNRLTGAHKHDRKMCKCAVAPHTEYASTQKQGDGHGKEGGGGSTCINANAMAVAMAIHMQITRRPQLMRRTE